MKRSPGHFLKGKINRLVSQTWFKFIANGYFFQQRRPLNHLISTSPFKLRARQCKIITRDLQIQYLFKNTSGLNMNPKEHPTIFAYNLHRRYLWTLVQIRTPPRKRTKKCSNQTQRNTNNFQENFHDYFQSTNIELQLFCKMNHSKTRHQLIHPYKKTSLNHHS